jgi:hypothetical protein
MAERSLATSRFGARRGSDSVTSAGLPRRRGQSATNAVSPVTQRCTGHDSGGGHVPPLVRPAIDRLRSRARLGVFFARCNWPKGDQNWRQTVTIAILSIPAAAQSNNPTMTNVVPDGGHFATRGKIQTLDPGALTLTIVPENSAPVPMTVAPGVDLTDVSVGDVANVHYTRSVTFVVGGAKRCGCLGSSHHHRWASRADPWWHWI